MICFECGRVIDGEHATRSHGGNPVTLHARRCAKVYDRSVRSTTRAVTTDDGHLADRDGYAVLNRPGDSESFDG